MSASSPYELPTDTPMFDDAVLASVLVPVYNEAAHLRTTVPAMLAQRCRGAVEFIFIDGDSSDSSVEILTEFQAADPRIRILRNPRRRTPIALNIGLRAARGSYIARMDAHAYYPADYLQIGVDRLEDSTNPVTWVSGLQVPVGGNDWSRRVALALSGVLGRGDSEKWPGTADGDAELDIGTSVFTGMWKRETVDELGGWDERFPVGQDSEMAARVISSGGRIVCRTDMSAEYVPRSSLKGVANAYRRYGEARGKLFYRHPEALPPSRWAPAGLVWLALIAAPRSAPRIPRDLARMTLGAYAGGLVADAVWRARTAGRDALYLPIIYTTMHFCWGVGFLTALVRYFPRRGYFTGDPPRIERQPACQGRSKMLAGSAGRKVG